MSISPGEAFVRLEPIETNRVFADTEAEDALSIRHAVRSVCIAAIAPRGYGREGATGWRRVNATGASVQREPGTGADARLSARGSHSVSGNSRLTGRGPGPYSRPSNGPSRLFQGGRMRAQWARNSNAAPILVLVAACGGRLLVGRGATDEAARLLERP